MRIPTIKGDALSTIITLVEGVVAALLVVLAVFGTVVLGADMFRLLARGLGPAATDFTQILDATLVVFIIAELFKIALAYIRHEAVIPTVMEAALVAVARKLVVLDTHVAPLDLAAHAGAYAVLLVAVGVVWYLLARTKGAWLAADAMASRRSEPEPGEPPADL